MKKHYFTLFYKFTSHIFDYEIITVKKRCLLFIAFSLFQSVNAQIINFPDPNLKARLIQLNIDTNNNGEIEQAEVVNINYLNLSNANISNLSGLEYFTNLWQLSVNENTTLTTLTLSGLPNLKDLFCNNNPLISVNLSNLPALEILLINSNGLYTLDTSNLPALKTLSCSNNYLTTLNLQNNINLENLTCALNNLTSLNLPPSLDFLQCSNNNLQFLDVTNTLINILYCSNNALAYIKAKNGILSANNLLFDGNPNLEYICADEGQVTAFEQKVALYGLTGCHVNSYCSFMPGGTVYHITGSVKLDNDTDGCDAQDTFVLFSNFGINNGIASGNFFADATGNYNLAVQAGTHLITPILENPSYFTVTPTNAMVTFPTAISPYIQDFCITPNGIHNDLEVAILPLNAASPGFDANYKISFKNTGTNTQSGNVNLSFDDTVLDIVTATPSITNQTINSLTWSFTNLAPFETREILVIYNLNSPTETPALNSGDVLNFTASINGLPDETPEDNVSTLNQLVVNSFDPNDKTCVEGTTISPEMIGEYVHYMIRFENNGTANAQNIVVLDRIDVSKLDISTLLPINSSHSFITRITDTNKVEFIFENINLPFDDANNDGYVAFKIKTNPTLVVGNTFSNNASIYFDYNFPIITNTAITTIQALVNSDFEFGNYFTIAPNPVNDFLTIKKKADIDISSLSIYNALGQLIITVLEANSDIDVSQLKSGNNYIKVISNEGTSSINFIKK